MGMSPCPWHPQQQLRMFLLGLTLLTTIGCQHPLQKFDYLRPEMGTVIARGGLAAAIGIVTAGIGTLIPLLQFGKEKPSNCNELIAQAKADVGVKASDLAPRTPPKKR